MATNSTFLLFLYFCYYNTVVSEKNGTFICEIILEHYIYLANTAKQLKITVLIRAANTFHKIFDVAHFSQKVTICIYICELAAEIFRKFFDAFSKKSMHFLFNIQKIDLLIL